MNDPHSDKLRMESQSLNLSRPAQKKLRVTLAAASLKSSVLAICLVIASQNSVSAQANYPVQSNPPGQSNPPAQINSPEQANPSSLANPAEQAKTPAQTNSSSPASPRQSNPVKNQAMTLKSVQSQDFNKPINFEDPTQEIIWELDYDIESSKGESLKMGPIELNDKSLQFFFSSFQKLMPQGGTEFEENFHSTALMIQWPEGLFPGGQLEMISRTGRVLWKYEIKPEAVQAWSESKQMIRKKLPKLVDNNPLMEVSIPVLDWKDKKFPVRTNDAFRFCLSQSVGRGNAKICSGSMGLKSAGGDSLSFVKLKSEVQARVLVKNETAKEKDTLKVAGDMPTLFYVDLNSGISYDFVTQPNQLKVSDIAETKQAGQYQVVGWDALPANPSQVMTKDEVSRFVKAIGFESTIGDFRKFWTTTLSLENPYLYLPGVGGGLFRTKLNLTAAPKAAARPYLASSAPVGTYSDEIRIKGRRALGVGIRSTQNKVTLDPENRASGFVWHFASPDKGQMNRSYLDVSFEGKSFKGYYEVYRGYANEVSARMTGVAGTGNLVILGEIAYNHWFESFAGLDSYYFSRQRWGLSGKYFQGFNKIQTDSSGSSAALSVLNVDGKYRLSPGLWGRDETLGAMLSYQSVSFGTINAPMLGVGAFWARSMPRVFDDMFNYFSWFRYPKWVDMEFIYYASSLNSDVTLDSSMSLNFHGQVMWSDTIFGEAGFGLKRYAFTEKTGNLRAALNTFYGTVGLGIKF